MFARHRATMSTATFVLEFSFPCRLFVLPLVFGCFQHVPSFREPVQEFCLAVLDGSDHSFALWLRLPEEAVFRSFELQFFLPAKASVTCSVKLACQRLLELLRGCFGWRKKPSIHPHPALFLLVYPAIEQDLRERFFHPVLFLFSLELLQWRH